MNLNKTQIEKIALMVIGAALILTVLYIIFMPRVRMINQLGEKISEEKEKIEKAKTDISELPSLQRKLTKLREGVAKVYAEAPMDTPDWLLGRLNTLAEKSGVIFDKIEPRGDVSRLEKYVLEELYIELKTDYHRLGSFVSELENSSPFLKIVDISIAGNKDDAVKHFVKLTVGAYVLKENKRQGVKT